MSKHANSLTLGLALLACVCATTAQEARYFRISGPTTTTITTFLSNGNLVWSNAQPNATYWVQTVSQLPARELWTNYVQITAGNTLNTNVIAPMGMALIPPGTFIMGDSSGGAADAYSTNITVSTFYMDVNLVTAKQWNSVYKWATNHGYAFDYTAEGKAPNHPVQSVNWYDCVKWNNARSQQAGLTPVYYTDAELIKVYTNQRSTTVYINWTAKGFRLPTEAEWEKAARGGLSGQRFPLGNTISDKEANYTGDPGYSFDLGPYGVNPAWSIGGQPYTSPVASFPANGYGLYDMAGNVFEWCWDIYGTPYGQPTSINPTGPTIGNHRVQRGGCWATQANYLGCAFRLNDVPEFGDDTVGFRSVRGL